PGGEAPLPAGRGGVRPVPCRGALRSRGDRSNPGGSSQPPARRQAGPQGGETEPMAAAAQFPKPEGGANRAVAGAAGGQPAASHGLCAQGRAERCLVRAQRAGGLAALANVAATCAGQWPGAFATLCPQPAQIRPGHPRQRVLSNANQPHRGSEQPHQGHQAHGLWISRLGLLLPENQGRVPRESAMNLKKAHRLERRWAKGMWNGLDQLAATLSGWLAATAASIRSLPISASNFFHTGFMASRHWLRSSGVSSRIWLVPALTMASRASRFS